MKYEKFPLELEEFIDRLRKLGLTIHNIRDGKIFQNQYWDEWGYAPEQLVGEKFLEFVHPDDRDYVLQNMVSQGELDGKGAVPGRIQFRVRDGEGKYHTLISRTLDMTRDISGKIEMYIGLDLDISVYIDALQDAESRLKETETIISAASVIVANLNLSDTIDAILDQASRVISFNSASVQLYKNSALTIIGSSGFPDSVSLESLSFPIPGDNPNTLVIRSREPLVINDELVKRFPRFDELGGEGIDKWMGVPLIFRGTVTGMIAFDRRNHRDFTVNDLRLARAFAVYVAIALENALHYERTLTLSVTDSLTSAYTRRWMNENLQNLCELAARHGHELSVLMIDIDYFKNFNDNYGHIIGDSVLRRVVELITSQLRRTDSVCRYGGEEFLVILPHTPMESALEIGERIRQEIEENSLPGLEKETLTISLGAGAYLSGDRGDFEEMIARADTALLNSKAAGRNRITAQD